MSAVDPDMESKDASVVDEALWQRLSPVSVVFFAIRFTVRFIKQGLLNALPALAAFAVFANNHLFWIAITVPVLILGMLGFSVLYYWNFKFQAGEDEVLIQRGVFSKEFLNLHYGRVQNVNIGIPFYFAPFKLVNCIIESAGSKSTEVDLPGVSKDFGECLKSRVFAVEAPPEVDLSEAETQGAGETKAGQSEEPVLKLSNWESAKYGLTSYLAFVVLAGIAPFFGQISERLGKQVFPRIMAIVEPVVGNQIVAGILILVVSVFLFFVVITTGSMVGALVRFYNFELHDDGDKLVRVAGFFERKSTTLTKQKVQSVSVSQNVMARLLNRVSLQYRQVGERQNKMKETGIRIPMLMPQEQSHYSSMVFDGCPQPRFSKVHPSYVSRVFFYYWLLPFIVLLAAPVLLLSKWFLLLTPVLVPAYGLLKLRYHRYGFWHNEEYGAIRQGLFGKSYVVFPLYKVQVISARQSRGQRRRKVGNLQVQLGSGKLSIPYLPIADLNRFVNLALYKTESSQQPWM